MNEREFKIEIPNRFYSDVNDRPFAECNMCGKKLLDDNTTYVIEKSIKNYKGHDFSSTIYEIAICTDCHSKMQKSMSEESMMNLQNYYNRIIRNKGSQTMIIDVRNFNIDSWLSECFFYGGKVSEMEEYQIVGQFKGNKLIMNNPPIIVGEKAMYEMSELLSEKTKEDMNGYRDKLIGPSPEIEELVYGKKLILL